MAKPIKLVVALAAAAALVAAGFVLGGRVKSPRQAAADALPPPPSLVTATVELRSLVDVYVTRGRLVASGGVSLTAPSALAGPDSVVTALKVRTGTRLMDGQVVLEVSGEPLVAAVLPFRLYRDIRVGDSGPDVLAFSQFLKRLGYLDVATQKASASMRNAFSRLLSAAGYTSLVDEGGSSGVVVKSRWILRIDKPLRQVSRIAVSVGSDVGGPDVVLIECDATPPTVAARVDQAAAKRLTAGDVAHIVDDANSRTVDGSVSFVDSKATADAVTGVVGYLVTISPSATASLAGLPDDLRVTIESHVGDGEVAAVPTTAIFTDETGDTHVTLVETGVKSGDVGVQLGRCVGGWCQLASSERPLPVGTALLIGYTDFGSN